MAEDSKHRIKRINVAYLEEFIASACGYNKRQFAKKAGISRTTLDKALRGEPISERKIRQICREFLMDREQLIDAAPYRERPEQTIDRDDELKRPSIVSLVSIRGGVGKTQLAVSLASELATQCRVALVDADLFTYGATRWFTPLVRRDESPLTFLDIAFRSTWDRETKEVLSTRVEQPVAGDDLGTLFFVPAHAEIPGSYQHAQETLVNTRPVLVDWDVETAQESIDRLIDELVHLQLDVIILDTHPGLMTLTVAICREADCNILVSDFDSSTLQANWLLAWEIRRRQMQTGSRRINAWRVAINRIPTTRTVNECRSLVEDSRRAALRNWPQQIPIQFENSESTDPVFVLPELEAMRLDELESYSPTSIKRRGGNRTSLATKHLVRRLASQGILPKAGAEFPYANVDNQIAGQKLHTYIENYGDPWHPGSRRFNRLTVAALVAIFLLFLINYATLGKVLGDQQVQPASLLVLKISSVSIVCMVFLIIAGIVREIIRECRSICWFIDGCAISRYPAEIQQSIYDAGLYPRLAYDSKIFSLFLLLIAVTPTSGFVGLAYEILEPSWRYLMHGAMALILVVGLWSAPGKSCVFRVLRLRFSASLQRMFRRQGSALTDPSGPEK